MSPRGAGTRDPGPGPRPLTRRAIVVAGALACAACAEPPPAAKPEAVRVAPVPAASSVPAPATPAEKPAPPAPSAVAAGPKVESAPTSTDAKRILLEDPELRPWIGARAAAGKAGARERVRIPLVRQSVGWGCVCPPYYVGVNANMEQGPWLDVKFPKGVRPLGAGEAVVAEGTFTGVTKHVRYPHGPPPSGAWEYDLLVFEVTTTSPLPAGFDESEAALERL